MYPIHHCQSENKAADCGFEAQRKRHQKSKTGLSVVPQKGLVSRKNFLKSRHCCELEKRRREILLSLYIHITSRVQQRDKCYIENATGAAFEGFPPAGIDSISIYVALFVPNYSSDPMSITGFIPCEAVHLCDVIPASPHNEISCFQ